MRHRRPYTLFLLAGWCLASALHAQLDPPFMQLLPAPGANANSAEVRNTVQRAIEELSSEDTDLRLGAAMLLGKYPTIPAREALLGALEDPELKVRRAAVISLLDRNFLTHAFDTRPLLRLIEADDVEIRRAVSGQTNILVSLLRSWLAQSGERDTLFGGLLSRDLRQSYEGALLDPDPVVRRNVLQNQGYLGIRPDEETLARLLLDPDLQVRLLALPQAARMLETGTFLDLIEPSLDGDPEPGWQIAVVRALERLSGDDGMDLLERLSGSDTTAVADEAAVALFSRRPEDPRDTPLYARLKGGNLSASLTQRFVSSLLMLREAVALETLVDLMDSRDATVRQETARYWLLLQGSEPEIEVLVRLLEDPSAGVRQTAIEFLERRPGWMTPELRDALVFSEFVEIREFAFTVGSNLTQDEARDMYGELLLDENDSVRVRAIYEFVRRRLDGWQNIARASLEDRSEWIRFRVANFLLNANDAASLQILVDYIQAHPETELSRQLIDRVETQLNNDKAS